MKSAEQWAASLSTDSTLADDIKVIAAAMAEARETGRREGIEACIYAFTVEGARQDEAHQYAVSEVYDAAISISRASSPRRPSRGARHSTP
jgi:hypothetical protein